MLTAIGIRIEGVSRRFGDVRALNDVSVEIRAGEFFSLLGSSGSGKSTLLKLIGGFDVPDAGRILFDGKDVSQIPANRRPVNTVFQDLGLFPHMSVAQNVGYGLKVQKMSGPVIARRVAGALSEMRHVGEFDFVIINNDLDVALGQLKAAVTASRLRFGRQRARHPDVFRFLDQD